MFRYIPLHLLLFVIIGICIGDHFYLSPGTISILFIGGGFILFVEHLRNLTLLLPSKAYTIVCYFLAVLLGINAISFSDQSKWKTHFASQKQFNQDSILHFTVEIQKLLKPSDYYFRYEAKIKQLESVDVDGRILLYVDKTNLTNPFEPFERFIVTSNIDAISAPKNPGEFDYKNYLKRRQIYHKVYVKDDVILKLSD